jgi:hypothetical protein
MKICHKASPSLHLHLHQFLSYCTQIPGGDSPERKVLVCGEASVAQWKALHEGAGCLEGVGDKLVTSTLLWEVHAGKHLAKLVGIMKASGFFMLFSQVFW